MRPLPRHCLALLLAPPLAWLLVVAPACITSSPAQYGRTPMAKRTQLPPCPDGMLDDGEDGNSQIHQADGRDGYWFAFVDTLGSTITPRGQFEMSPGGRPGQEPSKHHARMRGTMAPAGESLYAGVGFALTNPKGGFDLSQAGGIRFWAKGPGLVRFKTPDVNTDPAGDRCTDCYNDFGVDLYLSESWERYTIPFDQLQQQPGWGDRAPHVATGGIMAVQFQFFTPGATYDLGFDDVELVGCAAPKSPSGRE